MLPSPRLPLSPPSIFPRSIEFAQHPVYSTDSFVVRHKESDPAVENRDLDSVVGQDQLEVVVFHWIDGLLVPVNATEIKQALSIDRGAYNRRNSGSTPYFCWKIVRFHAFFEHTPAILNLFQILDHIF